MPILRYLFLHADPSATKMAQNWHLNKKMSECARKDFIRYIKNINLFIYMFQIWAKSVVAGPLFHSLQTCACVQKNARVVIIALLHACCMQHDRTNLAHIHLICTPIWPKYIAKISDPNDVIHTRYDVINFPKKTVGSVKKKFCSDSCHFYTERF